MYVKRIHLLVVMNLCRAGGSLQHAGTRESRAAAQQLQAQILPHSPLVGKKSTIRVRSHLD